MQLQQTLRGRDQVLGVSLVLLVSFNFLKKEKEKKCLLDQLELLLPSLHLM